MHQVIIILYKEGARYRSYIFALLAIFTHFSTSIFVIISFLIKYLDRIKLKYYAIFFASTLLLSFIGFGILNLGLNNLEFDKAIHYTSNIDRSSYETGFRLNFAAFNTAFFLLFYYWKKYQKKISDYLFKLYSIYSGVFFLWFVLPYSDRIGAFSWLLIPSILYLTSVEKFRGKIQLFYIFTIYFTLNLMI